MSDKRNASQIQKKNKNIQLPTENSSRFYHVVQ